MTDLGGVTGYIHRPWANTFKSFPEVYYQPSTVEQVQEIVRTASNLRKNLVVTGATHSPTIITWTNGWLVNLDNLSGVLEINPEKTEKPRYTDIKVKAGTRLFYLNIELAKLGLSLQNLGSISDQSVAGVISTGTHGSSYCHGLISEQFVQLKMVIESGEVVTLSEKENPELFSAVLLGLGAFGVIVEATIRCVPAFNLRSRAYVMDFEKLLENKTWNSIFLESEFHRIWWYPYVDKCFIWQADRTTEAEEPALYSFYGTKLGRFCYELLLWIAVRWKNSWTPIVERWLFRHQFDEQKVVTHVGRSDREINMDCLFKQFVNEWSLPLSNGQDVLRHLKSEIRKENWYVHAPFEIRASNTTLPSEDELESLSPHRSPHMGPIYGNVVRPILDPSPVLDYAAPDKITNKQLTLNLNATMYRPFRCDPEIEKWYECFESVCAEAGGKPHWAKLFKQNPWHENENKAQIIKWRTLKEKWAPNRIFGGQEWLKQNNLA